jgi:hypothetical protein
MEYTIVDTCQTQGIKGQHKQTQHNTRKSPKTLKNPIQTVVMRIQLVYKSIKSLIITK